MKNKSIIFFTVALLLFVFVCILVYLYVSKNPTFMQNKTKIENTIVPAAKKVDLEDLSSQLEEANKNSTTTEKDLQNIQNALEKANKNKDNAAISNKPLDLQAELEKQAQSDSERRELIKALEQANR